MKVVSPLCIQEALDQIGGPVKNAPGLQDGFLLVETRTDDQAKKLPPWLILYCCRETSSSHLHWGIIFCPQF
jgi:hypothetical protein